MPPELSNSTSSHRKNLKKMEITMTKKRLVQFLLLILAFMSVFRLLRLALTTYPRSTVPSLLLSVNSSSFSSFTPSITLKEFRLLKDLISRKSPCNLLIFGLDPKYLILAEINSHGKTIILEDNPEKLQFFRGKSNNTKIYKVEHPIPAKEAYKILKQARKKKSDCFRHPWPLEASKCRLALTGLPREVYGIKWDVIIVDGPSSDGPEASGRMGSIYSAGILARAGGGANVVVHDVDRVIEKWFSWEFLCEENLVSSSGKFWNFRIEGGIGSNSTAFCSPSVG